MKLSILIPTLPEEYSITLLARLNSILDPQIAKYSHLVEKRIHDAPRSLSTGAKRNQLIQNSDSEYFCMIDSDDIVPIFYVEELLHAIEKQPDVITFIGEMTTDGGHKRPFTIKLGSAYEEVNGHYYRPPNHLCCFKRSVVEKIKFPDLWVQEDYQYAMTLKNLNVLQTEVHINRNLYLYDFRTEKPNPNSRRRR